MSTDPHALPVHPRTGLTALGLRRNGDPIWPVMGGAPDDADTTGDDPAGDTTGDADGDDAGQGDDADQGADQLGDAGKQALDRMKTERNAERDRRKAAERELADLKRGSTKTDEGDKPDLEALKAQARDEARAEALVERVHDKIEAKAARLFADPADAAAFLARRVDDFVDDGKVDVAAIDDALEQLLKEKPYLAAAEPKKRFTGGADGGTRKESRPNQLTREDLERMSPREIEKARADGRLTDLLSGKRH